MQKFRKCICCSREYNYCGNCPSDKDKETWYALYCSANCHDIFHAANDYGFGLITKEEAKKKIEACDLSNLDNFNPIVMEDVKEILAEPKVEAVKKSKLDVK